MTTVARRFGVVVVVVVVLIVLLGLATTFRPEVLGALRDGLDQHPAWQQSLLRASGTNYYVDSIAGADSNPGNQPEAPWKTLSRVERHLLRPGDTVHLKRGSVWTGRWTIAASGVPGNPIVVTAYGSGNAPVLRNPGSDSNWTHALVLRGDWLVVEDLFICETQDAGVSIETGAEHNIVRNLEITNAGAGVRVSGQNNLVTGCFIHDLHMVKNTGGGDDDFGAVGVWVHDSRNEVAYCLFVNCRARSQDYGWDGGAVEWWADHSTIADCYVHHNYASGCNGFVEIGSSRGEVRDSVVAFNVTLDSGWLVQMSLTGTFGTKVRNIRIEHNTLVQPTAPGDSWSVTDLLAVDGTPEPATMIVRNNIFHADGWRVSSTSNFVHSDNLYHIVNSSLGLTLTEGEIEANPRFVNANARDYRLSPESPAIDGGTDLGHSLDFDNCLLPAGSGPDIGAFESLPHSVDVANDAASTSRS